MITSHSVIEALLLVIALSMDAFVFSFAYGTDRIKIPIKSVVIINLICTLTLALSLFLGRAFRAFIPMSITSIICFTILILLGIAKMFDSTIKTFIRRHNNLNKKIKFSIFNLNFILNIYANPQEADFDLSRILSPREAAYLAFALSLDGLAVGLGVGLTNINTIEVVLFSLVFHMIAIILGDYIGNKFAEKLTLNLSWLSGLILIILATTKLHY